MVALDLIRTARRLAMGGVGRPLQADLRRSISTAYYAMFHCIARAYADALIGTNVQTRDDSAWRQAYRSITHTQVRNCCSRPEIMRMVAHEIQDFGAAFTELQAFRDRADYDPNVIYFRSEVLRDIKRAERVIKEFKKARIQDRKAFITYVATKYRRF